MAGMNTDGEGAQVTLLWDERCLPRAGQCGQAMRINRKTRQRALDLPRPLHPSDGVARIAAVEAHPRDAGIAFDKFHLISNLGEVIHKVRRRTQAKEHILIFCEHRITSARSEAFNTIVSSVIDKACGVANLDFLFLKLRQESLRR